MGSGLSQQTRDRLYTCKKNGGKELTLANCELKKIPSVAWKFKQLHRLNVSRNLLQLIPPDIKLLPLLAELDASTNEINEIAPDIGVLDSLTHLDLSNNSITSLPILPKSLKILKLSFNNITSSGELDFPVINELYYGHNKITIFPPQILTYQSIRVLDLSGNRLTYVPDEISNLGTLEALDLSDNQFNAVPVSISLLTNLRTLNIGGNPVGGMFREILELTKLEFLNANKCRLTTVDMDIGKLVNLTELHLKENNILEFPRSFCNGLEKLTNLRVLDVSMSALTVLPRQVGYPTIELLFSQMTLEISCPTSQTIGKQQQHQNYPRRVVLVESCSGYFLLFQPFRGKLFIFCPLFTLGSIHFLNI